MLYEKVKREFREKQKSPQKLRAHKYFKEVKLMQLNHLIKNNLRDGVLI